MSFDIRRLELSYQDRIGVSKLELFYCNRERAHLLKAGVQDGETHTVGLSGTGEHFTGGFGKIPRYHPTVCTTEARSLCPLSARETPLCGPGQ